MKKCTQLLIIISFCSSAAVAQHENKDTVEASWAFSTSAYYYFVPEEKNALTLVGTADHNFLHLEGRYNYEDMNTGSLFVGRRFEFGKKIQFGATPIIGYVFGNTHGLAPGLEFDATYKIFDFYSESEYVFDFAGKENHFFYTWSEIAVSPFDKLRTGISIQRTKLYQTEFDIQRGIFADYNFWKLTAGLYYFNPFNRNNLVIVSLSIDF